MGPHRHMGYAIHLVDSGAYGTTIGWSAEPAGLVDTDTGSVTRPAAGEPNEEVVLTATISKEGGESRTKEFRLTIVALPSPSIPGGDPVITHAIVVTAGPGGSINPKTTTVTAGTAITFTVTPDMGYEINDVLVDGASVGARAVYTFESVTKGHSISATFRKMFPFSDVGETDWFYESVRVVFEQGLMTGTATDSFSPLLGTSRAMIVTILHRLEHTPDASVSLFTDIPSGVWYTDAVAWAAANGIVQGYGDNRFMPEADVTREQIACILFRYAKYAGYDVSLRDSLTGFADANRISEWAVEAMQWAVGSGLIGGKGDGVLDPIGPAKRAEIAAILQRFIGSNTR